MQFAKHQVLVAIAIAWALATSGCAMPGQSCQTLANPTFIPLRDPDYVWEEVVDVVDDYFSIREEQRVRILADAATEGRIDTYPQGGATLLEPWRKDAANNYERLEGTLQTIRRIARVRVIPAPEGFLVEVVVFKELEDLVKPEKATSGAATFRHDSSLARYNEPVGVQPLTMGWIPMGRDTALEQKILNKLSARLGQQAGWPFGFGKAPPCEPGTPGAPPMMADPPQRLEPLPAP